MWGTLSTPTFEPWQQTRDFSPSPIWVIPTAVAVVVSEVPVYENVAQQRRRAT